MTRTAPSSPGFRFLAAASAAFILASCGEPPATPAPAAPQTATPPSPAPEPPPAPTPAKKETPAETPKTVVSPAPNSADAIFAAPPPVELNGFGSDEPVERKDLPSRGVIKLGLKDFIHTTMEHWEQYDWTAFKPARWGRYSVRLTYTLSRPSLPVQFRLGDQRLKKNISGSTEPKQVYLGEIYVAKAEPAPFSMFAPTSGPAPALDVREIAFIPAKESPDSPAASADGSLTLPAKSATTWSQTMRYEPKPEKNCLGFWTDPADFAEWEFVAAKPGRYRVTVTQGCGPGNGGSQVEIRVNGRKTGFTVVETKGFQDWKDVEAGSIEITEPGLQRLVVQPLGKKGGAVMDIQKIVLTPAS